MVAGLLILLSSEKISNLPKKNSFLTILFRWVNDKIGTNRKVKHAPSHVVALTTETFDSVVLGSKAALVEFYAPWCGHCKSLAPKYEQLAKAFAGESEVVIAKVDATEEQDLASR